MSIKKNPHDIDGVKVTMYIVFFKFKAYLLVNFQRPIAITYVQY